MKSVALIAIATVLVLEASVPGLAQTAAAAPPTTPAAVPAINATPAHIPLGSRVGEAPSGYDDGGRRDPFMSLVVPKRATAQAKAGVPHSGLGALSLADIVVSGIVGLGSTKLAILEGPNKVSFVSRVKDRLSDAVVVRIDDDGVVFAEVVEAGARASNVRKPLRPSGSAGEDLR
jgi:hypothetical protein